MKTLETKQAYQTTFAGRANSLVRPDAALLDEPLPKGALGQEPGELPFPLDEHRPDAMAQVGFVAKWLGVTMVSAAVLWPVVDRQINYSFKSLPQYVQQEWVWWVKTTR